jgi:hypothetical protein
MWIWCIWDLTLPITWEMQWLIKQQMRERLAGNLSTNSFISKTPQKLRKVYPLNTSLKIVFMLWRKWSTFCTSVTFSNSDHLATIGFALARIRLTGLPFPELCTPSPTGYSHQACPLPVACVHYQWLCPVIIHPHPTTLRVRERRACYTQDLDNSRWYFPRGQATPGTCTSRFLNSPGLRHPGFAPQVCLVVSPPPPPYPGPLICMALPSLQILRGSQNQGVNKTCRLPTRAQAMRLAWPHGLCLTRRHMSVGLSCISSERLCCHM